MKKILLILLCLILLLPAHAADVEITDDYTVEYNKDALLAALFEADISSLREAIDMKLITCLELTEYYLERISEYNDTFQCFITLCDNAPKVAMQRDAAIANGTAEGLLFGIPIVVKDNIAYEGYPTTNGLSYVDPPISEESALVVQRLLDEGAVILGKTNMSAAAQDAICSTNAAGLQTFNAYDPNLASGGSSGGSAVAVCLNFAAAGLGTDTNVSLRYPSALNGCVSLRPTYGLIDNTGCILLNHKRDTVGAITRSVSDQAIMLDAMLGSNYYETLDPDALNGLRIGVLTEFSYPIQQSGYRSEKMIDDDIQNAFDRAVEELKECGAEVVSVSMPTIFSDLSYESGDRLYKKLEDLFRENRISALIYPTYQHTPHYTTKEYLNGKNVYELPYICNCATFSPITGSPEITVPIGQHTNGAGIGMEILALKYKESLLLDIAYSYTQRFDHRTPSKVAPSLYRSELKPTLHTFLQMYRRALQTAEAKEAEATVNSSSEPETTAPTAPIPVSKPATRSRSAWLFVVIGLLVVLASVGLYYATKKTHVFK